LDILEQNREFSKRTTEQAPAYLFIMSNWIEHPTILNGREVALIPLDKAHFAELEAIAADQRIWAFYTQDFSQPGALAGALNDSLLAREQGREYPFVIVHRVTDGEGEEEAAIREPGKLIGSTRFLDIQPPHRKLEIGWTWLHPDYWATGINRECKRLLLSYCFERLGVSRVQLKTDENNVRSRAAIQKIGGRFEGILRNEQIRANGTKRNSAFYSIIEEEWPELRDRL
jgi:RimJ/RimL family protein N-acetyltransferase